MSIIFLNDVHVATQCPAYCDDAGILLALKFALETDRGDSRPVPTHLACPVK